MLPLFSFYFFYFLSSSSFDNWVEIGDELPCFTLFSLVFLSFIILFSSSSHVWAGLPCSLSIFLSLSFLSSCLSLLSFLILSLTRQKTEFLPSLTFSLFLLPFSFSSFFSLLTSSFLISSYFISSLPLCFRFNHGDNNWS